MHVKKQYITFKYPTTQKHAEQFILDDPSFPGVTFRSSNGSESRHSSGLALGEPSDFSQKWGIQPWFLGNIFIEIGPFTKSYILVGKNHPATMVRLWEWRKTGTNYTYGHL